jgi:hypothetical protein
MKDLKTIIDDKVNNQGFTKMQIYNELNRSASSFEYALKKMSFSLQEFETIAKFLNLEPNYFFDWTGFSTQNLVNESPIEYQNKKNEPKSGSLGEVDFLRGQILELNAQIRSLTSAINNLTAK